MIPPPGKAGGAVAPSEEDNAIVPCGSQVTVATKPSAAPSVAAPSHAVRQRVKRLISLILHLLILITSINCASSISPDPVESLTHHPGPPLSDDITQNFCFNTTTVEFKEFKLNIFSETQTSLGSLLKTTTLAGTLIQVKNETVV